MPSTREVLLRSWMSVVPWLMLGGEDLTIVDCFTLLCSCVINVSSPQVYLKVERHMLGWSACGADLISYAIPRIISGLCHGFFLDSCQKYSELRRSMPLSHKAPQEYICSQMVKQYSTFAQICSWKIVHVSGLRKRDLKRSDEWHFRIILTSFRIISIVLK